VAPKIPFPIPLVYRLVGGSSPAVAPVDTGGYDVMIGNLGFRYATDQNFPFRRTTEQTTINRIDQSYEPGEQTLSKLPWIKSQSSFHGGAGEQNLEAPFTAFQYQQEQVAHIRFDTSLGVDVWTPGKVTRLPDCSFWSFGFNATEMVTASVNDIDYAVIGGTHSLYQVAWTGGVDSTPTITAINLTDSQFGGMGNVTVQSLTTDGYSYYALITLGTAGSIAGVLSFVISGAMNSTAAPVQLYNAGSTQITGTVGWAKERLMAVIANKMYELPVAGVTPNSSLPATAVYGHPQSNWGWTAISESPDGVLAAGATGNQASILKITLDTSGATPVLAGASSAAKLPLGEIVNVMDNYLGTYVCLGTNKGVRVASFDTYSGNMVYGPLSLTTTQPVYGLCGADRFVYAGYSNQQADGSTGLARLDLSFQIDTAGRLAWAPDLRPPSTAPTGRGTVTAVSVLPHSGRIIFLTAEGIHVQQGVAGNDPGAQYWLRTSRIRYGTSEPKLFKLGSVRGTLDTSSIHVLGLTPFSGTADLGTFGPIVGGNPGNFRLPTGLNEWIQLEFHLNGQGCVFNSYQARAFPAPQRQHLIEFTVSLFENESDDNNDLQIDPLLPRARYEAVKQMEAAGNEVNFVEFTPTGPVSTRVLIEQIELISPYRFPNATEAFGGYLTFHLRETET